MPRKRVWWGGRRGKAGLGTGAADRALVGPSDLRATTRKPVPGESQGGVGPQDQGKGWRRLRRGESKSHSLGGGVPGQAPAGWAPSPRSAVSRGESVFAEAWLRSCWQGGLALVPSWRRMGRSSRGWPCCHTARSDPTLVAEELRRPLLRSPPPPTAGSGPAAWAAAGEVASQAGGRGAGRGPALCV